MDFVPYIYPYSSYKLNEFYKKCFKSHSVLATTSLGPIKGIQTTSYTGYNYYEFRGIPYAKPPLGKLRFKDPEPAEPWTEPLVTTHDSIACQKEIVFRQFTGNENCLHVNVYTKNLTPTKLAPVMVYIHGGAFNFGSNTKDLYSPEFLLEKDIVLILVNYRLGAFGFLSLNDPDVEIPGNAGFKDQVLALKWVRDNAANFGGDPNNVTLFGESAGGCSVHYHLMSEMSRGLFHKAIAQSGTALNMWSLGPIKDVSERLGKALGWTGEGGYKKLVEILQSAKTEDILKAQDKLITREERRHFVTFPFGPVIEPYKSKQCFIPETPVQMSRKAWSKHIPLMLGGCSGEGLFLYRTTKAIPNALAKLNNEFERVVPGMLEPNREGEHCLKLGAAIKEKYFGDKPVNDDGMFIYLTMIGDNWFWHGIHRTVRSRLAHENESGAPTYLYRFDFDSQIQNHSKFLFAGKGIKGTCHADDCSYLFKTAITGKLSDKSKEFQTVKNMVSLWTSFATTGNPNSDGIETKVQWEPVSKEGIPKCLNITNELEFFELPEHERMLFWDMIWDGTDLY